MASPATRSFVPRSYAATRGLSSNRFARTRTWRDRYGRRHRGGYVLYLGGAYPGYYYYPYDYGYASDLSADYGPDDSYSNDYANGYGNLPDDTAQQPIYSGQPMYGQQPPPPYVQIPAPAPGQYAAAAPAAPQQDPGVFILVRTDGRILFASAFTFSGDQLIYITREGLRRTFPAAELDKDATRRLNDAAGTTVAIPG
jgi:hypothetical protein